MDYNSTSKDKKQGQAESKIITRIWRGWTLKQNADEFEKILTGEAIPAIEINRPEGCLSIQLLKRETEGHVEFTTVMQFNSIAAIKAFAGEDFEAAHIDPKVKRLLLRYDERVAHHQTLYAKVWQQGNQRKLQI
jgi:hypothetical protein